MSAKYINCFRWSQRRKPKGLRSEEHESHETCQHWRTCFYFSFFFYYCHGKKNFVPPPNVCKSTYRLPYITRSTFRSFSFINISMGVTRSEPGTSLLVVKGTDCGVMVNEIEMNLINTDNGTGFFQPIHQF